MALGERIRECRQRCRLSQEKVAELVGVSRQAVTKWEAGQTAPNTENLFKLAEIFGTTVDMLAASEESEERTQAEYIYHLYKTAEEKLAEEKRAQRRKKLLAALAVAGGYLLIYLIGRLTGSSLEQKTFLGWLLGTDSEYYLFGWLIHKRIYWAAMIVTALPALFGKHRYAFTTLGGFALGIPLGEWLGVNPAGAPYGHGHYGWAIWGGIFLVSMVMGILLEVLAGRGVALKSKKGAVWAAVAAAGVLLVILWVRGSMSDFSQF